MAHVGISPLMMNALEHRVEVARKECTDIVCNRLPALNLGTSVAAWNVAKDRQHFYTMTHHFMTGHPIGQ
jgi:hypothetical protein